MLDEPLSAGQLSELAAHLGADVPFFLASGPQLGTGDGTQLDPVDLPLDYAVLLLLPEGVAKLSTGAVYDEFDRRGGEEGFEARRAELLDSLRRVRTALDLADLPRNDLSASPLAAELERLGAFRAGRQRRRSRGVRALRERGRCPGCGGSPGRPRRHAGLRSMPWYGWAALSEQAHQPQAHQPPRKTPFYAQTRVKIAISIAAVEAIVVAASHDWSKWTVIVVAIPIILFYLLAGRMLESDLGRQISWIAAASQALAVIVVLLWYWIEVLTFIIAGVFAVIALYLLFVDRPSQGPTDAGA